MNMQPFAMDHRRGAHSRIDLSFLLDPPAGRDGFVTVQDGHLVKPNGARLRLWGVNVTDWSPGSVILPAKADAPLYAATLARFGINCVRLHFLDLPAPRGLIDPARDDSQHFDLDQLDRLDFWLAELKRRGIYCDLNLVVGRSYKAGDGVPQHDEIGWAKAVTYFDPRLIELQKAYATQLLTHYNPYSGAEYRHEPAIVIVEIANENSLIEAWHSGSLRRAASPSPDADGQPLPAYYLDLLDRLYGAYLARRGPAALARLRTLAGVGDEGAVPRLSPEEFATAPAERFHTEAAFYMDVERDYFRDMQGFLRETLGVRALLIGSNDHAYSQSGYPMVWSNSVLDVLDGHMYWQHPAHAAGQNTPMVNDAHHSTVVRLARTAVAGKPYTVSETNHIFPGDWISEGLPILAAYAAFQDWDGLIWYTFEPKWDPTWAPYVGDQFDLSLDPVRMPQIAAGALLFLRGDVGAARTGVERSYTLEQVRETLRLPADAKPYYTLGFALALPLQHRVRIGSLEGPATTVPEQAPEPNPILSDTGELAWWTAPPDRGLVTVDAPRSQALIGFVPAHATATRHLAAEVATAFCAITLSALDGAPIARATRLLLTAGARVENSGQQWNAARTDVVDRGGPPSLIEPVTGRITLRHLDGATAVRAQALDGAGAPLGAPRPAEHTAAGWVLAIGDPATTWYVITVARSLPAGLQAP